MTIRPTDRHARAALGALAMAIYSCRPAADTAIGPDACAPSVTTTVIAPGVDSAVVVRDAAAQCVRIATAGDYLVTVQLAAPTLGYADYAVDVARLDAVAAAGIGSLAGFAPMPDLVPSRDAALRFEAGLRAAERTLSTAQSGAGRKLVLAAASRAVPPLGAIDTFRVIGTLTMPYTFVRAAARLVYRGTRVLAYVDVSAPAGWSDAEWAALGAHLEDPLYGVDTTAFGQPSDIDGNGRVIVVFTPRVNALVSQIGCATQGFVTGYFYAFDLSGATDDSNRGEVFFAYVPDPGGIYSCPHDPAEVRRQLPATFVHEFQHMISYNQHALVHGGLSEDVWLNEGLSHLAEELASRVYERRYPAPTGRTNSRQLFPDSSGDFILPDLANSFRWLQAPATYAPTRYPPGSYGSLQERGASWLFVRWLLDRTGDAATRALLETSATGRANVEAVAGTSMDGLLATFNLALWLDSIPDRSRPPPDSPKRFRTRNLREIYAALLVARPGLGSSFPLAPLALTGSRRATLRPGATQFFTLTVPVGGLTLAMRRSDGAPVAADWRPQLGVVRLAP